MTPKPAIIYARFSPRRVTSPSGEVHSIETQLDKCQQFCDLSGLKVVEVCKDEFASGKNTDREELQRALSATIATKGVLVAYSLSRVARNTKDALEIAEKLQRAGGDLAFVRDQINTSTPGGRFFFTVMAAIATLEREQTAERTKDTMAFLQGKGRRMTRPDQVPYGFQIDPQDSSRVIEHPQESQIVTLIREQYEAGKKFGEIRAGLVRMGIKHRSRDFDWAAVKKIVERGY